MAKRPLKRTKSTDSAGTLQVSAPLAARVLGLSRRQFDRLVIERVLPRAQPRLFDLAVVGPAYTQYLRDGREGTSAMAEARLQYVRSQRRALDQRTRERAGQLVEEQEAKRVFCAACALLAGQLDAGPGRLLAAVVAIMGGGEVERAKLHEVMRDEFKRIRESCAAELLAFGSHLRGGDAAAAAPQANGGGMGAREP
jgi:hypothetical protein